jgi:hypothetical protein
VTRAKDLEKQASCPVIALVSAVYVLIMHLLKSEELSIS